MLASVRTLLRPRPWYVQPHFPLAGIVSGFLAVFFIRMFSQLVRARASLARRWPIFENPYLYALIVAIVTSLFTYGGFFGRFMTVLFTGSAVLAA